MQQEQNDQLISELARSISQNPPQTQDGQEIIAGLAASEQEGRIRNAAEIYNLAKDMDEDLLRTIGEEVYNGFKNDEDSRQGWLDQHTFWLSLYMQQDHAETSDSSRSWGATESVPILTESCNQFQSRTYKIFFPNDTFVSAIPMLRTTQGREQIEDRAERIGRHMSYQLGFEDRAYKPDKDALFLGVAVHGSFFTKTYFDATLKRFKVDNIRPTDFVVNYHVGGVRIEDLRRKSHVIYTTVGETEQLVNSGYLLSVATPCTSDRGKNIYNVKVDEIHGVSDSNINLKRDKQAILIEQHLYLDLDDSGMFKPYIATIDLAARKILRLSIGYEADSVGLPTDDYKQVQYFTHYKFRENPDGFYGLGLGHDIGDLNSAINIMLRQSIDAATLANDGNMSGFVSERLGLEGDEISMSLGKLVKVPDMANDLASGILLMKFPGPNQSLIGIMQELDSRAQRMASTTEATTGTPDKVIQPTTYMAQIEQALEAFSSVQMRLASALSDELMKIYKINQKYLPFVNYFVVNGAPEIITSQDYVDDMLIMPIFDPKYSTQAQKVARAQAELQATMQNPVNQSRPQVYDAAFKRYLEALEVENVEELIPPQPQIENFDDQILENMYFLMPKESRPLYDVFPMQNHMQHLMQLQEFAAQYGQMLDPEQQEAVLKHQQKHQGYLYGQQNGIIDQPPPASAPNPPLAARSGNEMGDAPFAQPIQGASSFSPSQGLAGSPFAGGTATSS